MGTLWATSRRVLCKIIGDSVEKVSTFIPLRLSSVDFQPPTLLPAPPINISWKLKYTWTTLNVSLFHQSWRVHHIHQFFALSPPKKGKAWLWLCIIDCVTSVESSGLGIFPTVIRRRVTPSVARSFVACKKNRFWHLPNIYFICSPFNIYYSRSSAPSNGC